MCQISWLLQRWCFRSRGSQTHWCRVKGKQTWNVKALWTYLKLEQGAFMKLSAGSKLVLIKVTCSEQEVMIGLGVADPVGLEVTTGGFDYVSLFVMHIHQSIWSFSCSSISFMNGDFVLCWATGFEDVFSCVLEIKLQSTRVHMYAINKKF